MSLRDEYLQQALRHAPDQALAPSSKVRERVLDYAENAVKPKPASWLKRCLNAPQAWRVSSWQVAGMGAIASVLLVMVMVREQLPDESIWVKPEVKDVAKNDMEKGNVAQNKIETPVTSAPQQDKLKARQDEPAKELDAVTEEKETVARAEGGQEKVKRSLAKDLTPPDLIAPKKLAEKTEATSLAKSVVPELAAKNDVTVAAAREPGAVITAAEPEVDAKQVLSKTAPASVPVVSGMLVYVDPIAQVLAKEGGATMAKKDIEAGNLRMLKIEAQLKNEKDGQEGAKPIKHELSADALTNYKVVVISACTCGDKARGELLQREADAYNKTMLQWYQAHKN